MELTEIKRCRPLLNVPGIEAPKFNHAKRFSGLISLNNAQHSQTAGYDPAVSSGSDGLLSFARVANPLTQFSSFQLMRPSKQLIACSQASLPAAFDVCR
jgi:hypothetical protein